MTKKYREKLIRSYSKYRRTKRKMNVLEILRVKIPEIIYRTTKLEGEPVTRKMVSTVLKK